MPCTVPRTWARDCAGQLTRPTPGIPRRPLTFVTAARAPFTGARGNPPEGDVVALLRSGVPADVGAQFLGQPPGIQLAPGVQALLKG